MTRKRLAVIGRNKSIGPDGIPVEFSKLSGGGGSHDTLNWHSCWT